MITTLTSGKIAYAVKIHPDDDKQNILMAGQSDKKILQYDMNSGDVVQAGASLAAWSLTRHPTLDTDTGHLLRLIVYPYTLAVSTTDLVTHYMKPAPVV